MHGRTVPKKAAHRYSRLFRRRGPMRVTTVEVERDDEQDDAADVEREVLGAGDDGQDDDSEAEVQEDEEVDGEAPQGPTTPANVLDGATSSESARSTPEAFAAVLRDEDDDEGEDEGSASEGSGGSASDSAGEEAEDDEDAGKSVAGENVGPEDNDDGDSCGFLYYASHALPFYNQPRGLAGWKGGYVAPRSDIWLYPP